LASLSLSCIPWPSRLLKRFNRLFGLPFSSPRDQLSVEIPVKDSSLGSQSSLSFRPSIPIKHLPLSTFCSSLLDCPYFFLGQSRYRVSWCNSMPPEALVHLKYRRRFFSPPLFGISRVCFSPCEVISSVSDLGELSFYVSPATTLLSLSSTLGGALFQLLQRRGGLLLIFFFRLYLRQFCIC